jgi:hypothetical protein
LPHTAALKNLLKVYERRQERPLRKMRAWIREAVMGAAGIPLEANGKRAADVYDIFSVRQVRLSENTED